MTEWRLTARALSCRRGSRLLFADLGFDVAGGEALAITGPNGAGKTSLIRIIAGLLPATSGVVSLEPSADDTPIGERCHMIGAREALKPSETVGEALAFWQAVYGGSGLSSDEALAALGIARLGEMPCGDLSSGQRRRVALARLLLTSPAERPLWLLDEPTNALDTAGQVALGEAVARHRAGGGLVLAATHVPLDWPGLRQLEIGA